MEGTAGILDWELLQSGGGGAPTTDAFIGIDGESTGAIKPDYFSLDSDFRFSRRAQSDADGERDSLPDSDNPSWIDPEPDSTFPPSVLAGFWTSDESSPGDNDQSWDFDGGVDFTEESRDLSPILGDISDSTQVENPGGVNLGKKPESRWWKIPIEILKFCVLRIKPTWSISFAAAILGIFILKRTLSKKKPKNKRVPINLNFEDKASQLLIRASKFNEAFNVVKRAPMIRSTVPTIGMTPFPLVALR